MILCYVAGTMIGQLYTRDSTVQLRFRAAFSIIDEKRNERKGGENNLDPHEEIVRQKLLPQVGQTVRSKKHGTLWKVIEKRQVYSHSSGDPVMGDFKPVPAIYLIYWKIKGGARNRANARIRLHTS